MEEFEKNELLQELMADLKRKDKAYSLEGPKMLTVRRSEGSYRNKECFGTEFLPEDARIGQRDVIFVFLPEDPQEEYVSIEVAAAKMDETFPLFLEDVQSWMLKRYIPGDESRIQAIEEIKDVRSLMLLMFFLEEQDLKAADEADDSEMVSLPNFGMF